MEIDRVVIESLSWNLAFRMATTRLGMAGRVAMDWANEHWAEFADAAREVVERTSREMDCGMRPRN